jgi:hypothetical protein
MQDLTSRHHYAVEHAAHAVDLKAREEVFGPVPGVMRSTPKRRPCASPIRPSTGVLIFR